MWAVKNEPFQKCLCYVYVWATSYIKSYALWGHDLASLGFNVCLLFMKHLCFKVIWQSVLAHKTIC